MVAVSFISGSAATKACCNWEAASFGLSGRLLDSPGCVDLPQPLTPITTAAPNRQAKPPQWIFVPMSETSLCPTWFLISAPNATKPSECPPPHQLPFFDPGLHQAQPGL